MNIEDPHSAQPMTFAGCKVVEVMRRRDLDGSGAELPIHEDRITHDGNGPMCQRNPDPFADEIAIARIFRMHGDRSSANRVSGLVVATRR